MIIPVYNPSVEDYERSWLSQGVSAGVTSLTIDNVDDFASNDRIMIGELGREKTEVVTVSAVVGNNTLTVGTTKFAHEANSPVTILRFDQIKYYRSTTGLTGTYNLLSTVDIDVDNADLLTNYDDTTGVSTYYYKVKFYHSISTAESTLSDPISGGGYDRNTVGFVIDELLREIGDETEESVSRTELIGYFNEVNDDIITRVRKPYGFLHTRAALSRTAQDSSGSGAYLSFPTDMWKFDRLDYNYVDNTTSPVTNQTYTVRMLPPEEFRNRFDNTDYTDSSIPDDKLMFASIDEALDRIRIWPPSETSSSNVFYLYYWKNFTELDSEGDTFETPNPRIYKLYALGKYFRKQTMKDGSMASLADRYFNDYEREVNKLRRADGIDAGSPRGFRYLPQTTRGNRRY